MRKGPVLSGGAMGDSAGFRRGFSIQEGEGARGRTEACPAHLQPAGLSCPGWMLMELPRAARRMPLPVAVGGWIIIGVGRRPCRSPGPGNCV